MALSAQILFFLALPQPAAAAAVIRQPARPVEQAAMAAQVAARPVRQAAVRQLAARQAQVKVITAAIQTRPASG
jgi:hypothetical protein